MTDEPEIDTATLNAAQQRLTEAVRALLQPTTEPLGRSARDHRDVLTTDAEADLAHAERMGVLRRRHAAYGACKDAAGMRRTLAALIEQETAHRAAVRARLVDRAELPSLLDQLHDAVHSTQGGGGASAGVHRSPIGLAAAELLGEIGATVRPAPARQPLYRTFEQRRAALAAQPRPALAAQIRSWAGLAGHWRTTSPRQLVEAANQAHRWVGDGRDLLNPRRRMTASGACPRCGQTTAHVRDDTGEEVRRPALEIDVRTGWARCIVPSCDGSWPPERLPFLASLLEQQAEAEAERQRQAEPEARAS